MKTYTHAELYGENTLTQSYKGYVIQYDGYFDRYLLELRGKTLYENKFKSMDDAKKYIDLL